MPASRIRNIIGVHCQTSARIATSSALVEFVSQAKVMSPATNIPRIALTGPRA